MSFNLAFEIYILTHLYCAIIAQTLVACHGKDNPASSLKSDNLEVATALASICPQLYAFGYISAWALGLFVFTLGTVPDQNLNRSVEYRWPTNSRRRRSFSARAMTTPPFPACCCPG
ncbi:hypothetical protein ACL2XP_18135 [Sodalis sp. RH21]|uniref:hypothetical protein n=1 Tax=unclassified Sodalis (in: enterobacteria) TaxID=2636512 RepID=UPI0039B44A41